MPTQEHGLWLPLATTAEKRLVVRLLNVRLQLTAARIRQAQARLDALAARLYAIGG